MAPGRIEGYIIQPKSNLLPTTPVAPPVAQLNLVATGYKVRGQQTVGLSWTGSTSVAIYRGDSLVTNVSGNSYDDKIGKGDGTYTHQVCDTVSGFCSNVTTIVF